MYTCRYMYIYVYIYIYIHVQIARTTQAEETRRLRAAVLALQGLEALGLICVSCILSMNNVYVYIYIYIYVCLEVFIYL